MKFNSIDFILFFPVVCLVYFKLTKSKYQNRWLLLSSIFFYMYFIPAYIFILFTLITIDYAAARWLESVPASAKVMAGKVGGRKALLVASISATCIVLCIFKYYNFFIQNSEWIADLLHIPFQAKLSELILPIGLSFHTFQSLSYVIEVYRGNFKAEKNYWDYALYVMFFPQLVAGPIERPYNLLPQFKGKHDAKAEEITAGLRLMLWGFFKKMVIADNVALYVDYVFDHSASWQGNYIVVATACFAIQIYCDFSGYTDIARGAAQVLGFRLMENFHFPYSATSIRDFWRRWHISLSSWFRDYVYIPLGGSRSSLSKWIFNILIVFFLSGFWHGANYTFIIWGLLHGIYLIGERLILPFRTYMHELSHKLRMFSLYQFFCRISTVTLVCFAWIFFRAKTVDDAFNIVSSLRTVQPRLFLKDTETLLQAVSTQNPFHILPLYLLLSLVIFFLVEYMLMHERQKLFFRFPVMARTMFYYAMVIWIVVFGVYFSAPNFIYFQF